MLLRVHDPDRGASFVEYAGVVLVVAAIIGVVAFSGVADGAGRQVADGIRQAFGGDPAESVENTSSDGGGDGDGDGDGGTGGGDGDDGDDSGGDDGDDSGDEGCDGWTDVGCHASNAADTVTGGVSTAWDWTVDQGGDFLSTGGEALWGTVTGLGGVFTDPVGTFSEWGGGLLTDLKEDPTRLIVSEETRELLGDGRYGAALGVGVVDFFGKKIPGTRGGGNDSGGNNNDNNDNNEENNGNDGNGNNDDEDNNGNNRDDEDEDSRDNADSPEWVCQRGSSFVPGTEVLMADGARVPIETVDVGDEVWAFDPATGEEGPRAVTDLIDGAGEQTLVDVEVTDSAGEAGSVTATAEHPFWVPQAGQWVEAAELDPGTWLRTSAGTWTQVTAVDVRTVDDQQTHNLTVADLHTYYVGAGDNTTLVHNQNDPCGADQWTSEGGLDRHYNDHGEEMGYESQAEYRAAAEDLMCECDGGRPGVTVKVEGSTRYYLDPESGEFGVRSDNGVVTFFEPDNPQDYYNRQPGTEVS